MLKTAKILPEKRYFGRRQPQEIFEEIKALDDVYVLTILNYSGTEYEDWVNPKSSGSLRTNNVRQLLLRPQYVDEGIPFLIRDKL